jgi:hypothetical protein
MQSSSSIAEINQRLLADWFEVREAHSQCHIYLLLDDACPVAADSLLHETCLQTRPVVRERMRVGAAPGDSAFDWRPIAVQLCAPGENGYPDELLIGLSVACALERAASINGAYVAAWVATDKPLPRFAAHVERCTQVFDMHAGRSRKLPLYQPHRMELLAAHAQPIGALAALLQGVHRWWFVDAAGELRSVHPTLPASDGPAQRPALRIGNVQGAMQARVAMARRVLVGLREAGIDVPQNPALTIDGFLSLAEQAGLRNAEDQVLFVLNSVSMSPEWHDHPAARAAIRTCLEEDAPLAGILTELDDATVEAISTHLTQEAPRQNSHNIV